MDKSIIIITKEPTKESLLQNYYIDNFQQIFEEKNITSYWYFIGKTNFNLEIYNKKGIYIQSFENFEELLGKCKKHGNILYLGTFDENLIPLCFKLRTSLGIIGTESFEIFNNKNTQRQLLLENNENITVKYLEYDDFDNIKIEHIENKIGYPFIIKPSIGFRSMLVTKVNEKLEWEENLNRLKSYYQSYNKSTKNNKILIEEFIDGKMYSIDYFVDENQKIHNTKPVKVVLLSDLGYNDFLNLNRILGEIPENELLDYDLDKFICDNIKACGIKNNFIHHEFKLTSKGNLKTIELNGRIGGFRLEMYKEGYGFNLLNLILKKKFKNNKTENISTIGIYSINKGILKGFNKRLFEKIRKLSSFKKLTLLESRIGKECGLSSQGFGSVGNVKLKNTSKEQIEKDIDYIYSIYKDLVILV